MHPHPDQRLAGILTPLFALRGESDLGIGDIGALREMADWCASREVRVLQILPINETSNDNSPYNAISASALDPTTIETTPDSIKELSKEDFDRITAEFPLDTLRTGSVQYKEVKTLKRKLLEAAFSAFQNKLARNSSRARKFAEFCTLHADWLADYTLFRALMEQQKTEQWDLWPEDMRTAATARLWLDTLPPETRAALALRMQFFAFVQWIAFSQWKNLRKYCDKIGVALMGDIPIGVSYYSSDVFSRPEIFDLSWSCGAPPERVFASDPFTVKWGQNWGVPLYRWDVLEAENYAWWRRRVQLVTGIFHLFRIDHILGFYRIYAFPWRPEKNAEFLDLNEDEARERTGGRLPQFIPRDDSPGENADANRRGGEQILRALLDEVGDFRLIGEDLGVVPEYVRPSLLHLRIAGFKVPQWEKQWDGRLVPGGNYERLSITTYATHDHPPMRTLWEELVSALAADNADAARWEMQILMDYAGIGGQARSLPYTDEIREGLLNALFESNAWLAVPMITDVLGMIDRFNVPGEVADSNWSHRLLLPIAQWEKDAETRRKIRQFSRLIKRAGRALK